MPPFHPKSKEHSLLVKKKKKKIPGKRKSGMKSDDVRWGNFKENTAIVCWVTREEDQNDKEGRFFLKEGENDE